MKDRRTDGGWEWWEWKTKIWLNLLFARQRRRRRAELGKRGMERACVTWVWSRAADRIITRRHYSARILRVVCVSAPWDFAIELIASGGVLHKQRRRPATRRSSVMDQFLGTIIAKLRPTVEDEISHHRSERWCGRQETCCSSFSDARYTERISFNDFGCSLWNQHSCEDEGHAICAATSVLPVTSYQFVDQKL